MKIWEMMTGLWVFDPDAVLAIILSASCATAIIMGFIFWWISSKNEKRRKTEEGKWQIRFSNFKENKENELSALEEKHNQHLGDIYTKHRDETTKLEEVIAELKQKFGLYLKITNQEEEFENATVLLKAILEREIKDDKGFVSQGLKNLVTKIFEMSFKQIKLESNYTFLDKDGYDIPEEELVPGDKNPIGLDDPEITKLDEDEENGNMGGLGEKEELIPLTEIANKNEENKD